MAQLGHDAISAVPISGTAGGATAQGIGTQLSRVIWPGTSPARAVPNRFLTPTWAIGGSAAAQQFTLTLTAAQATSASIAKAVSAIKTATQASSAVSIRAVSVAHSAAQATGAAFVKSVSKAMVTAQSASATLLRSVFLVRSAIQSTAAVLSKSALITKSATSASAASLAKSVGVIRSAASGTSASLAKAVSIIRAASQASTASLQRAIAVGLAAVQGSAAALAFGRAFHVLLTAVQATIATLDWVIQRGPGPTGGSGGGDRFGPILGRRPIGIARPGARLAKPAAPVYDVAGSATSANGPQDFYGTGTIELVSVSGEGSTESAAAGIVAFAEIDSRIPTNRKRAAILSALLEALSRKWR